MEEILPKEKPGNCAACGASNVAHAPTYLFSTIDAWVNDRLKNSRVLTRLMQLSYRVADYIEPILIKTIHRLTGGKTLHDTSKTLTNRAYVLWEEARNLGITMEQIVLFGKSTDYYRVFLNNRWVYFDSLPVPTSRGTRLFWLDDKFEFKQFLEKHTIPTARAYVTASFADARSTFQDWKTKVVVKPRIGSRARHTTTNVHSLEDFEAAFTSAQQLCRYVIFEEHLEGKLCRATVVDGVLRGFLKKSYPTVTGDGTHTIRALVEQKNATKPERVWDIILDAESDAYIGRSGLTFESIPRAGEVVELSPSSGRQAGGDTREMPDEIHPKLHKYIEHVAQKLESPVVGFDLIIPDPESDPDTQKWGFLEANSLPFIDLHYNPLFGTSSNVAGAVWDLWL